VAGVLVLGGGFGGLAAAKELRSLLPDAEVTLVDRAGSFYMGFAKLWDLAGFRPLAEGTVPLSRLEERGVRFVRAGITGIEPDKLRVETTEGPIEADAILVALGAGVPPRHAELLGADGAYDLYDAGRLPEIHAALDGLAEGTVLVSILGMPIKCPPAPFEAALVVDEVLRGRGVRDAVRLAVSTPQPMTLPVAGKDASQYVAAHLAERNIEFLPQHVVKEVDAERRVVVFENGAEEAYSVLLGVPGCAPPPVVRQSPLAAPSGWIEPDRRTMRTSFERVYAVGDCTAVPTAKFQLPKAGVFAAAEGEIAAHNIAADLSGSPEAIFDGHGFCFLELPGRRVAYVEGDFYAEPDSDVHITEADEAQFERKREFERTRLAEWLG
jgi:sulfide:quinone oxidoreductase